MTTLRMCWNAGAIAVIVLGGLQPVLAQTADVSGKWMGTFDTLGPKGDVKHDTAYFILTQTDGKLQGSAGPQETQQIPLTGGSVTGRNVRFSIAMRPAETMTFQLRAEGGHLRGEASGALTAGGGRVLVDTTPVPVDAGSRFADDPVLYNAIAQADSTLFDAFNDRDLAKLKTCFFPEAEFYHDKDQLQHYDGSMAAFAENFARPERTRRELVAGSLEVYPIAGGRALELGTHRFYATQPGKPERLTATAHFVHLWEQRGGHWALIRVISYDHR